MTALHKAAMMGKLDVLKNLISFGAPVDDQDEDGYAPLHRAVINGKTAVVTPLLTAKVTQTAND